MKLTNLSFTNWDKQYTIVCHKETDNGLLPNTTYKKMKPWVGGGSPASSVDFVEQDLIDDMGEDYVQQAYENGDEFESFATVDQQDIDNGSIEIFVMIGDFIVKDEWKLRDD